MLRGIFLENFVKFERKVTLDFAENESPRIFVGENGSGKSSVLEGIRRCLSSSTNTTWSSVYSENNIGYFVCKYDIRHCSEPIWTNADLIFTGMVQDAQFYYKFISTSEELIIDQHSESRKLHQFKSEDKNDICKIYDDLRQSTLIVDKIIKPFTEIGSSESSNEQDSCVEQILKLLGKYVILTFPLRSIGPLQWSKSKKISESKRKENYLEASDRSEIIKYFLEKEVENEDEFDLEKEKRIFRDLTGHCDIQFELTGENGGNYISVKSTETTLPGGKYALLKLPEGMLEAKYFSVLMSGKHFQTLVLEEPDRGMHPQMIERMLAIIQKESHNKVVVLTTHNPCFVSPLTVSRLTIFKRIRSIRLDNTAKEHAEIISGNELASVRIPGEPKATCQSYISMKTLRIITRDHLASLIFARRIVFCEGDTDFLFLTSLKEKIISMTPGVEHVLSLISGTDIASLRETLQKISVSVQIINMNGWNNAQLMHDLCKHLKLEDRYFVCDKDAIMDDTGTTMKDNHWMDGYKEIRKNFNEVDYDWEKVRDDLRTKSNCYAWRDGTIEDMVISLLRSETRFQPKAPPGGYDIEVSWSKKEKVINQLKQEHVSLPIDMWQQRRPGSNSGAKKRLNADKLFLSCDVTQENISNCTDIFLNACERIDDDLVRFIEFLAQMETV